MESESRQRGSAAEPHNGLATAETIGGTKGKAISKGVAEGKAKDKGVYVDADAYHFGLSGKNGVSCTSLRLGVLPVF